MATGTTETAYPQGMNGASEPQVITVQLTEQDIFCSSIECWKPYRNYEVSNYGKVRNKHGNIVKPHIVDGYYKYNLMENGERFKWRANRLVAKVFLGEPPSPSHQVDHIDRNRKNNHVSNLRYLTHQENMKNKSPTKRMVAPPTSSSTI
jgi:hypothetical protein